MERLRASSKTISLRNWRRPSATAAALASSTASESIPHENAGKPRPKTSRYRTDGPLSFNPLVVGEVTGKDVSLARPPMPEGTCIVLKYLVDFLVTNKLHKNDLFLLDGKPSETTRLLRCMNDGELPNRLSQYSSRSVSFVVLHAISHSYAPLLPELVHQLGDGGSVQKRVELVANAVQRHLSAERRALFESLLVLLFRLSRKATATMNAVLLGELVASKLVRGVASDGSEVLLPSVGQFLIENAREIVHTRQTLSRSQAVAVGSNNVQDSLYLLSRRSPLVSAAKIISRGHDAGRNNDIDYASPPQSGSKRPLDKDAARRVSLVLTAIVESSQQKHDLFTTRSRSRDSTLAQFLRGATRSVDVASFDVQELGWGLRCFLDDEVNPLLDGFHARAALEPSLVTGESRTDNAVVARLQSFLHDELPPFLQGVVVLLLATVRLALNAGTDMQLLVAISTPWMFARSADDMATSVCRVLLVNMYDVLQPLLPHASVLRWCSQDARVRQLRIVFWVTVWVAKCRQRAIQSRRFRARALRRPWSESMASSLCGVVDMLLEQTHAYPSQLRRLYLEGGDEHEIAVLMERLCVDGAEISAETCSPHSAALAVRRMLTTILTPLGTQRQVTPSQTRLKQLLLAHLDLLVHHESVAGICCDLEDAFDEMLVDAIPVHSENGDKQISRRTAEPQAELDDDESDARGSLGGEYDPSAMEPAVDPNQRITDTLSEWLASTDGGYENSVKQRLNVLPPLGFTSDVLEVLQDRLSDIRFVMKHVSVGMPSAETDTKTRLFTLLDSLSIPFILVPRQRAASTLDRIQKVNHDNKVSSTLPVTSRLDDLEIVETLVMETIASLGHVCLAPLYPDPVDRLGVLLDIWGLADRSVVVTRHGDAAAESC